MLFLSCKCHSMPSLCLVLSVNNCLKYCCDFASFLCPFSSGAVKLSKLAPCHCVLQVVLFVIDVTSQKRIFGGLSWAINLSHMKFDVNQKVRKWPSWFFGWSGTQERTILEWDHSWLLDWSGKFLSEAVPDYSFCLMSGKESHGVA